MLFIFIQQLHYLFLSHNDAEVWEVLAFSTQGAVYTQTQRVEVEHY